MANNVAGKWCEIINNSFAKNRYDHDMYKGSAGNSKKYKFKKLLFWSRMYSSDYNDDLKIYAPLA
ncbi:hypothetical protein FACS189485_09100 [Spirochaetia bacterium]|nr:hypothetical protein FACS189485_09100 [Spirochaetia bacterium]